MLTTKPLLKKHHYPVTGLSIVTNRHRHELSGWKMSMAETERKPYRKASRRIRQVGSREQTSVKLSRIYEVPASNGIYNIVDPSVKHPIITTHSVHDEGASLMADVHGVEYYRNMTEFFAEYPLYIGTIFDAMDCQVTVDRRHIPDTVKPEPITLDGITVIDGMPILLKDQ